MACLLHRAGTASCADHSPRPVQPPCAAAMVRCRRLPPLTVARLRPAPIRRRTFMHWENSSPLLMTMRSLPTRILRAIREVHGPAARHATCLCAAAKRGPLSCSALCSWSRGHIWRSHPMLGRCGPWGSSCAPFRSTSPRCFRSVLLRCGCLGAHAQYALDTGCVTCRCQSTMYSCSSTQSRTECSRQDARPAASHRTAAPTHRHDR
jgi:hypothetical protein